MEKTDDGFTDKANQTNTNDNITNWSVQEVVDWIKSLNNGEFTKYGSLFEK